MSVVREDRKSRFDAVRTVSGVNLIVRTRACSLQNGCRRSILRVLVRARPLQTPGKHHDLQPEFATVQTNGIRLRVALAGKGPLVVLVHGWPESWYSWRHQIPALAQAGYRVAAPDVRGYGGDKPAAIEAYASGCAPVSRGSSKPRERQAILVGRLGSAHCLEHFAVLSAKGSGGRRTERPHAGRGPAPASSCFKISTSPASSIGSISSNLVSRRPNSGSTCARPTENLLFGWAKAGRRHNRQAGRREIPRV